MLRILKNRCIINPTSWIAKIPIPSRDGAGCSYRACIIELSICIIQTNLRVDESGFGAGMNDYRYRRVDTDTTVVGGNDQCHIVGACGRENMCGILRRGCVERPTGRISKIPTPARDITGIRHRLIGKADYPRFTNRGKRSKAGRGQRIHQNSGRAGLILRTDGAAGIGYTDQIIHECSGYARRSSNGRGIASGSRNRLGHSPIDVVRKSIWSCPRCTRKGDQWSRCILTNIDRTGNGCCW